jgi:hypothetical protein
MQETLTTAFDVTALQPRRLTELVRAQGIDTPAKSVTCGVISVRKAVKLTSRKETAALIVAQIVRLQTMLNTSRQLSAEAIAETAYMVVDLCVADDVELNFADVDIVFRRAASGKYGKIFAGFGSADILGWFNDYITEKAEAFVNFREREKSNYNYYSPRSDGKAEDLKAHHAAAVDYYKSKTSKK